MFRFLVAITLIGACGCTGNSLVDPQQGRSVLNSPLEQGIYRGTGNCELIITAPNGVQTVQPQQIPVAFEINERGVPIVAGSEIREGRTVEIGDLELTYTRIDATATGIVIHGRLDGATKGVTVSGISIAELRLESGNTVEYLFTLSYLDSAGFAFASDCRMVLQG